VQTGKLSIAKDDAVKPERGRIGPFVELMEDLFPDDPTRKWVNHWLGYLIQHPDERLQTALVLHGKGAQGQIMFAEILLPKIFGPSNVSKIDVRDLKSGKSGSQGKQIIVVAYIAEGDAFSLHDSLRDTTSGETVRLDGENVPSHEIENFAHLILLSNQRPAVDFKRDDSRYAVSHAANGLSPDGVEEIRAWIENGGAEKVRFYLEHVKLDRFDPYGDPPPTDRS